MDWVKAHFDCSVDHVWIVFRERVKDDFSKWKVATDERALNQSDDGDKTTFTYSTRLSDRKEYVSIQNTGTEIVSKTNIGTASHTPETSHFLPIVDKDGECRLTTVDGRILEYWEVSRLVLLPLLSGRHEY